MIELIIIAIVVFFVWGSISDAKRVRKVQKSAENCKAKHEIVAILKSVSAELEKEYRQAMRTLVTAQVNGDHALASQMDERGKELQQELKKLFLTRFSSEVDARAIVDRFSDIQDVKVDLARNTIATYTWIFVGGLYIDAGKYDGFCIPYIFDAVEKAAKSIPNVSLSIDTTIPNQKN